MTNGEMRFMETVPCRLRGIEDAVKALVPRLVKVTKLAWINPCDVSSVCELPDDMDPNHNGGRVNVTMRNEMTFETPFKTIEEAFKVLGMAVG